MQHKETYAPELRFPQFLENWASCKIGGFASKVSDGIHTTPNYCDEGEYFFINGNNLQNGQIVISENTKRLQELEAQKHSKDLND
ncbi:MAG: restriction endonuclease subunit S, partial [Pseudomonadota bacterium]|nr:restriction endonuclease subunit S [Pseudomonadota bacterium]